MARPPLIPPEQRLQMFLQTVNDHPWAAPRHVQALSGLHQREFYEARSRAHEEGLVEQTCIRTKRNPPQRYALLPAGAQLLSAPPPPLGALRDALLRALDLDLARLLLAKWSDAPGLIWARSPFTVHARDLRPLGSPSRLWPQEMQQDRTYRSLRLEGLACLAFHAPSRFLHAAIIVDPGDVTLSWFFHQFRSVYAWQRRPEFHERAGAFPVFILLAANQTRLRQLTQLWRACARWGSKPARLYAMTRHAVEEHSELEQGWRDERQRPTRLWFGAVGTESESHVPHLASPPLTTSRALEVVSNEPRSSRTYGLLKWARKRQMPSACVVRDHLHIGARGRELLDRIGRYPLLTSVELAAVLDVTPANVYPALGELAARGLVERPTAKLQQSEGNGFALTGRGLTLLAAQAGFPPRVYAELRHWPLHKVQGLGSPRPVDATGLGVELTPLGKALTYSTDYLLARHAHARLVVLFMTGLLQAARASRPSDWLDGEIRLLSWDQEYLYMFSRHQIPGTPLAELEANSWVVPDAVGVLGVCSRSGAWLETEFWLEIDRSNIRGAKLLKKLRRYYAARGGGLGATGRLPRLLIVVESNDEARAQALRRRLEFLDRSYGRRLDALVTRVDLLDPAQGGVMDATRPVWRRPGEWGEMVYAFDGLPLQRFPPEDPRGIAHIDQRDLRAESETHRRRVAAQRRRRARERQQHGGS